MISMPL